METFKEINKKKFFRSRFEIWNKKNQLQKEMHFETKNEFKLKKL